MQKGVCKNCPMWGGQSCIVARRELGAMVIEDSVFKNQGLPLRVNCSQPYTEEQAKALTEKFQGYDSVTIGKS